MAFARILPFLTLGALCGSALAGDASHLGKRQMLADRELGTCHEQGWIPACPGTFACVPPGGICCSDDMSYALGSEVCPQGSEPLAATGPGPESHPSPGFGGAHSPDAHPPATTPPPSQIPGLDVPSVDFLGVGSQWYTFAMTFRFFSHFYSFDHASSWLVSTEMTSCTTVSVSATNEAQASEYFSSYTATAVLAIPTEAHTHAPDAVVETVVPVVTVPASAATGDWKPANGTVGSATRVPSPVVTAGGARLGGVGAAVIGLVGLVMGVVAVLV